MATTLKDAMAGDEFFKSFYQYIRETIEAKSNDIVAAHKKQIEFEIDAMRQQVIAGAAVRLAAQTRIEVFGTTLRIEIEKVEAKK